jgi:hypothetical protein
MKERDKKRGHSPTIPFNATSPIMGKFPTWLHLSMITPPANNIMCFNKWSFGGRIKAMVAG